MILTADLGLRIPVLGMRGQLLGHARKCRFDTRTQRMTSLLLSTRWQVLELPCRNLEFEPEQCAFQVRSSDALRR